MDYKITNIEKKYYVDEQGLCYDLLIDVYVTPKVGVKSIMVDITISSNKEND